MGSDKDKTLGIGSMYGVESFKKYHDAMKGLMVVSDELAYAFEVLNKELKIKAQNEDPMIKYWEETRKKEENSEKSLPSYQSRYGKNQGLEKWNAESYAGILNNENMTREQKASASESLGVVYHKKKQEQSAKDAQDKGEQIGEIVSGTLDDIILDFNNFDESMKNINKKLLEYLLKETMSTLGKELLNVGGNKSILSMLGKGSEKGGSLGFFSNVISGLFGVKKLHSGGVVPTSGYSLPGTNEQLAILKGGERVLSPGENAQYQNGQGGGGSKVNFVNFNVKAWDSKDVSKYLLENKQLLNAITSEGIKNNSQRLRQMVRNA